jgi:UPF0176 protein
MQRNDVRRVLTFYKFIELDDPAGVREGLLREGEALELKGTILVAEEGLNGTVVGTVRALETMRDYLQEQFGGFPFKWSDLDEANPGFFRYKVKIKPEIVTLGIPGLDASRTGEHVDAERWNELLEDPRVVTIDTRNQYEVDIGTFPNALSPHTENFREFPAWVDANLDPSEQKTVAMFCTGGIRCEKASAFLLEKGFKHVYQLDGGILKYLETVPDDHNLWQGECFVFDQRVSVTSELEQGHYQQCFACRHPLSDSDLESPDFEEGVSCPHCIADLDARREAQFRERQKQVKLADQRGDHHIGQPQAQHRKRS